MDEHNHTIAAMKKPVIASVKGWVCSTAWFQKSLCGSNR